MNSAFHPEAKEELLAAIDFYNASAPGLGAEEDRRPETALPALAVSQGNGRLARSTLSKQN